MSEPSTSKRQRTQETLPITLFKLGRMIGTDEDAVSFAQEHGLLPRYSFCPSCSAKLETLSIMKRASRPVNYRFRCRKRACRGARCEVSVKKGTWFEGSHISVTKSLLLMNCFAWHLSSRQAVVQTALDTSTSTETVTDFYNYCREIYVEQLFQGQEAKQIGGPNMTVEIDEAKFGKRKFNRGRVVEGQWVLGGICRETRECFFVPVEDRTENTLLSIILKYVRLGTIIHTDCFASYQNLVAHGYQHLTVNHTENFVDPDTGACTNLIESTWWAIRRGLPSNSAGKKYFASHLAEYIWRKKHRDEADQFLAFMRAAKDVYPGVGA